MSFSRAPLKRFNETVGCAPPPGSYDIKPGDLKGAASFDRSSRFKHPKDGPPPSPSRDALSTPVRRAMSVDMLVDGSSARKEKTCMTADRKQQKFLEKEIRSLVQQRGEQDRQLQALREELKKVEAKLLAFVREKTGLTANVTTLERQRAELKKINDFLKNKVLLLNWLLLELSVLRVNSEGQLKELDAELQAARNTATSLKERNTNLGKNHISSSWFEETGLTNVHSFSYVNSPVVVDRDLQAELEQRTTELQSIRDGLKQKEQELESSQKTLKVLEDEMIEANKKIYEAETTIQQQEVELLRLRDVLRRTENELDERVAHLEQRCVFSEEERSRVQEEGLRRVNQLKNELSSLSEARSEALRLQVKLKHANETLEKDLAKQKVRSGTLSALVQFERDQSEKQVKQLKDEMEEILGELTLMEEQDEWKQEAILTLKKQNEDLERQLSDSRSLLESQLQSRLREAESDRSQLQSRLREAESDRSQLQSRLREAEGDGVRLQDQLGLTEEKARASREQVEVLTHLHHCLTVLVHTQNSEGEQWKSLYEELFAKVQPFQEQLNAFAAQRDALLNENGANQEELNRLADAYAHLLGHQNQKQKIKHVIKLKDENVALKQEVSKLRSQVSRQKCDLEQLKAKLPGAPRRRFDPAKAFQHNKENTPSGPGEGLAELGASSLNAALKEAN
uniref:Hyaluronan-mediated motility receptor (RHAMM) n=1 Tax=Salarias fasciatus TaxID=181472 RepID=A0A672JR91_SALFA